MGKITNLDPLEDVWHVLKAPAGEGAKLEEIAVANDLSVEVYSPMLLVNRRVSRKRKPIKIEVEAYPGYVFARGDLEALRHLPQSRFGFLVVDGNRAMVSEAEIEVMRAIEEEWRAAAEDRSKAVEEPKFMPGELVVVKNDFFVKGPFRVESQQNNAVYVTMDGSSIRLRISPFLLDRIQAE